jgi:hypothetical protein
MSSFTSLAKRNRQTLADHGCARNALICPWPTLCENSPRASSSRLAALAGSPISPLRIFLWPLCARRSSLRVRCFRRLRLRRAPFSPHGLLRPCSPFFALLSLCSILCSCTKRPQNQDDVTKRAFELPKWGRYDAAAQLIQDWVTQGKGDVSHNDFLHFQIAMIYLTKVSNRQWTREESLHNATLHLEQALSIYGSVGPKD